MFRKVCDHWLVENLFIRIASSRYMVTPALLPDDAKTLNPKPSLPVDTRPALHPRRPQHLSPPNRHAGRRPKTRPRNHPGRRRAAPTVRLALALDADDRRVRTRTSNAPVFAHGSSRSSQRVRVPPHLVEDRVVLEHRVLVDARRERRESLWCPSEHGPGERASVGVRALDLRVDTSIVRRHGVRARVPPRRRRAPRVVVSAAAATAAARLQHG